MNPSLHLLPLLAAFSFISSAIGAADEAGSTTTPNPAAELEREARIQRGGPEAAPLYRKWIAELQSIRSKRTPAQLAVIDPGIAALEAMAERQDTSGLLEIIELMKLLRAGEEDESGNFVSIVDAQTLGSGFCYTISDIFNNELEHAPEKIDERRMRAMIRYYVENPAQYDEMSWLGPDKMLHSLGDRVVDSLVKLEPQRIPGFYKMVIRSRKFEGEGTSPDEGPAPVAKPPTAEKIRKYDAAFARLEKLAADGPERDTVSEQD